jgi:hypothetical protein
MMVQASEIWRQVKLRAAPFDFARYTDMPATDGGEYPSDADGGVTNPWRHGPFGDAEEPELHGMNHRTGHGDGPYRLPRGSHY